MNKGKLAEIGGKLDVFETDIDSIRKRYRLARIIAPITGGLIIILSTIMGYVVGNSSGTRVGNDASPILINSETGEIYPYLIPTFMGLAVGMSPSGMRKRTVRIIAVSAVLAAVLAVVGYLIAHGTAYDSAFDAARDIQYYSGAIEYGVYSKEE